MLHDKDIREPLFDFLEETYGQVRIIEEKNMGKSRADVVMVTPEALYGIEIKSDADTYARLATQVKDYDKYFDYNLAVVGTSHALHIREHIPKHWGVITVEEMDGGIDFYMLQKPQLSPKAVWTKKLEILWRPELAMLQEWNQMPKYKEKSKNFVISKIAERVPDKIPEQLLRRQVSAILMERDYNVVDEILAEYRKGEIQKKLEREIEPSRQIELMMKQSASRANRKRRRK